MTSIGSFSRDAVLTHARHIPDIANRVVSTSVPCLTFESLCRKHGVRYQAFSPLAGGWLAGRYTRGEPFPPGSRMALRPGLYSSVQQDQAWDLLDKLRADAEARGVDMATLALAWALKRVDSVVVGPRRPEHLVPALQALTIAA